MKKGVKITLWVFGSIVGLLVILFGLVLWVLTPERLTPLVNKYATQYIDGRIDFQRVEVSLFADFPDISISIIDGKITQNIVKAVDDTLLHFSRIDLSINPIGLVRATDITITSLAIDGARANVLIDSTGRASWDIVKTDTTTTADTTAIAPLIFNISQVRITGGLALKYYDTRDSTQMSAQFSELHLQGVASTTPSLNDISRFHISNFSANGSWGSMGDSFSISMPNFEIQEIEKQKSCSLSLNSRSTLITKGDTIINNLPVNLSTTLAFDFAKGNMFRVEQSKLEVSQISLALDGSIDLTSDSTINSDLNLSINNLSIENMINLVPKPYLGALAKINTNIALELTTKINGTYNLRNNKLPQITANISVDKGYLHYRGMRARVDEFSMLALAKYDPDSIALSSIYLKKLIVRGSGVSLDAEGKVSDMLNDPLIIGSVNSKINLGLLSLQFPSTQGIMATGMIDLRAACNARISNMNLDALSKTTISGSATMRDISITSPKDSLYIMTKGRLSFAVSKNTYDSTITKGATILRAQLSMDTISMTVGRDLAINSHALDVSLRTMVKESKKKHNKEVIPFFGTIKSGIVRMTGRDSTRVFLRDAIIDFTIKPSDQNATIPHLTTLIGARTIVARSCDGRAILSDPRFTFSATILSPKQDSTLRAEAMLDRLAKRYPKIERDNLLKYNRMMQMVGIAKKDDLASGDLDIKLDDKVLALMRRWRSLGHLEARRVRIITPYIPLPTTLHKLDFKFDNDKIELANAKIQVGRSDVSMNGVISNLSRALSGSGNLVAKLNVSGDTLDMTQLVVAMNAGFEVAEKVKSMVTDSTTEDQVAQIIKTEIQEQTLSRLIIVPKNIELNIKLKINKAFYGDITMDELVGELISRNRILQINHLKASSSIGLMELNAVYATRSKEDITTGFDLTLSGVNVKELIELIPEVDSLLPMLKSFEGNLDCALAATASLDSTMSLLIPTLNAAGSINGRNLVLLDGETFTEISKILRFKNKSRNFVDKISVELLVRNSAVEIFPFILELDRYKAAVSGVQKLDMNFDYHISVLKSIIPFRVGVDIYGNLDNWDFRITKARYKNENVPSYTTLIDTTRIDLRHTITDIFNAGLHTLVLKDAGVVAHLDSTELRIVDSLNQAQIAKESKVQVEVASSKQDTKRVTRQKKQKVKNKITM